MILLHMKFSIEESLIYALLPLANWTINFIAYPKIYLVWNAGGFTSGLNMYNWFGNTLFAFITEMVLGILLYIYYVYVQQNKNQDSNNEEKTPKKSLQLVKNDWLILLAIIVLSIPSYWGIFL